MKDDNLWFEQGCYPVFIEWLFHHILVVNWLSMVLIFVEVFIIPIANYISKLFFAINFQTFLRDSELRMRLVQINERERNELHMQPMDRMGDASKEDDE
uniref:Anoctamin n=1 Tax=Heterorhabditis bacteriophora TaxID=37862 RepID=A0A1I7XMZ5_HETBA